MLWDLGLSVHTFGAGANGTDGQNSGSDGVDGADGTILSPHGEPGTDATGSGGSGTDAGDGETLFLLGGSLAGDFSGGTGGNGATGSAGGAGGDGYTTTSLNFISGDGGNGGAGADSGNGGAGGDGGAVSVSGSSSLAFGQTLDLSGGDGGVGAAGGAGGAGGMGGAEYDSGFGFGIAAGDDGIDGADGTDGTGGAGGLGGSLTIGGTLDLGGFIDLSGGAGGGDESGGAKTGDGGTITIQTGGRLNVFAGAEIDVSGDTDGSLVLDGGTVSVGDQVILYQAFTTGTFTFNSGTIEFTDDTTIGGGGTPLNLALENNEGVLEIGEEQAIEGAGSISFFQAVEVSGGVLSAQVIGTNSNPFSLSNGGRLETGAITGNLSNNGGIFALEQTIAEATVVLGDYTQTSGSLELELGGTAPGDYDSLFVSGALTVGGDLDIAWKNGFSAAEFDVFDLFSWDVSGGGSFSGTFANVNLPTLGEGLAFDTSNLYTDGSIAVIAIPEPSAVVLFGLAGLVVLARRRR